jgi:acid phosphatase type 7
MSELDRRRFLQTASLAVAGGYAGFAFGKTTGGAPKFAERPTFEPAGLFLTWQRDPTTSMTIQWVGSEADADKRPVWYAKKGSQSWRQQKFSKRRFPMTDEWILRSELTGLEPDTDYVFRVGADSAEQLFRTMPAKDTNAIQFVSGGDCGVGEHPRQSNRLAAAQAPRFVILGGDLAYEQGDQPDRFLEFLKNYSADLRDNEKRLIPLVACIGNHEVVGRYGQPRKQAPFFYSVFDGLFPDTGYAALDFGQYMSLVFLDTNHTSPIDGAQTDWLARTLKEREDCPNLFVVNHVPAYPSVRSFEGLLGGLGTGEENRRHWVPLFERYRVDGVLEHHDHAYKRTHPLLDGRPNEKGVLYLGDGSWGKIRKPTDMDKRPYLAIAEESYHLSVHRIEGPQQFHVALSDAGRVVDVCMGTKRGGTRRG